MSHYTYLFSKLFNYADTGNYDSMAMFKATEQNIVDKIKKKDYTTALDIAYHYYEKLEAPIKKFYWFENEGHNNCYEDNKKFMDIFSKEILPET